MRQFMLRVIPVLFVGTSLAGVPWTDAFSEDTTEAAGSHDAPRQSDGVDSRLVTEARVRARLLHEMIHGALQVMHRDFFREDEGLKIPSRSLDDVFAELKRGHGVEVRWLAVNADAMSIDHRPADEFERDAVRALATGSQEFERVEGQRFRYVGRIRLASQCLKCHLPLRKSTDDRTAGVSISFTLQEE